MYLYLDPLFYSGYCSDSVHLMILIQIRIRILRPSGSDSTFRLYTNQQNSTEKWHFGTMFENL